ncbi:hypothetical protein Rhal01_03120 [Rubritalea halochordaticola]|uniref:Ice-binding protein C-terminal domain-containing protein n=1 Tax=Rubritalea halochordaticola TaxID=714537 RepID=A0ABP9V2N8_9BACT
MKTLNKYSSALLGAAASIGMVQAASISVNFIGGDGGNGTIDSAASTGRSGFEATNWNNVGSELGTQNDLTDSDGLTTTADVTWNSANVWGDGTANTDAAGGDPAAQLIRGYLDDGDTGGGIGVTFDVTNITYAQYSVVLYFSTDTEGGSYRTATVNGNTYDTTGTKSVWSNNPTFDDTNTMVITNLTGDLDVDLLTRNGGDRASISGFQIIDTTAVPEPSSTALLGLGAVAFILRRRK